MKTILVKILAAMLCALLAACAQEQPIRVGFIGGLSDRNSDNGQAGQNGVILAVEQFINPAQK